KSPSEIIEMMIGRDVKSVFPPRPAQKSTQPPALKVTNLSWARRLKNIGFEVRAGEVVGLGGLDGQGQRDLLLALFGALTGVGGSVAVNGKAVMLSSPRSTNLPGGGIALIPEDRKTEGLMMPMSLRDNLSFAAIDQFSRRALAEDKAAVLFYSTDYAELIGCCDRVLILYDGAIGSVLERDAMSERNIVARAHNLATTAADVPP